MNVYSRRCSVTKLVVKPVTDQSKMRTTFFSRHFYGQVKGHHFVNIEEIARFSWRAGLCESIHWLAASEALYINLRSIFVFLEPRNVATLSITCFFCFFFACQAEAGTSVVHPNNIFRTYKTIRGVSSTERLTCRWPQIRILKAWKEEIAARKDGQQPSVDGLGPKPSSSKKLGDA